MKDKRKNRSSEKEYDEIEIYVRDNENTKSTKQTKKKSKRDKKEDKKKNKHKKHTLRKILLTILAIIIVAGIVFFIHVQKNGGGLKGIVTTVIGSSAEKEKELQDIYMLVKT